MQTIPKTKKKEGNDKERNTDQETGNKQKNKIQWGKPITAERYFLDMINKLTYL